MYMLNNRLIPVLLHLKILARIEPMNLQNHLNVAVAYRKLGQHKLAIETLKNVQSQFPDTPEIHEGLADMYFEMEDFQHAIVQYRLVIDQDETRLTSYIQLGWIYYRLHDLPMAEAWTLRGLKKGKEVGQLKAMAQMNLGFYSLLQKKIQPGKRMV